MTFLQDPGQARSPFDDAMYMNKVMYSSSVGASLATVPKRARTETEAIERALDFVVAEHEKDRLALAASERFVKSGVHIADVYETLGG